MKVVGFAGYSGSGTTHLVDQTTDTQRYTVDTETPAVLRVSGRYDSGWSARVDGRSCC